MTGKGQAVGRRLGRQPQSDELDAGEGAHWSGHYDVPPKEVVLLGLNRQILEVCGGINIFKLLRWSGGAACSAPVELHWAPSERRPALAQYRTFWTRRTLVDAIVCNRIGPPVISFARIRGARAECGSWQR